MIRVGLGVCAGLALLAGDLGPHRPRVLWNATASAPLGLYRVSRAGGVRVGDWVVLRPPPDLAGWLVTGGYAPPRVPLLKRVGAVAGQAVCRRGAWVSIDGRPAARAEPLDRRGSPLPVWRGCRRLGVGDVFLLNSAQGSLDGRYFGVSRTADLVGRAAPFWTRAVR